jgi:hypothetical protein
MKVHVDGSFSTRKLKIDDVLVKTHSLAIEVLHGVDLRVQLARTYSIIIDGKDGTVRVERQEGQHPTEFLQTKPDGTLVFLTTYPYIGMSANKLFVLDLGLLQHLEGKESDGGKTSR